MVAWRAIFCGDRWRQDRFRHVPHGLKHFRLVSLCSRVGRRGVEGKRQQNALFEKTQGFSHRITRQARNEEGREGEGREWDGMK